MRGRTIRVVLIGNDAWQQRQRYFRQVHQSLRGAIKKGVVRLAIRRMVTNKEIYNFKIAIKQGRGIINCVFASTRDQRKPQFNEIYSLLFPKVEPGDPFEAEENPFNSEFPPTITLVKVIKAD